MSSARQSAALEAAAREAAAAALDSMARMLDPVSPMAPLFEDIRADAYWRGYIAL